MRSRKSSWQGMHSATPIAPVPPPSWHYVQRNETIEMSLMLATVMTFAVLNYALKSAGPVRLMGRQLPERTEAVIEALPSTILTGMLISGIMGERWSSFDPAIIAGLGGATLAWSLRAPHLLSVAIAVVVVIIARWIW